MRRVLTSILLAALATFAGPSDGDAASGLRVFIRAGAKTHGPGEHDAPAFLADWSKLLAARGVLSKGRSVSRPSRSWRAPTC